MGELLVSWISKKQTSISLSTTEEEYNAAGECYTQFEWMKQTLQDIKAICEEPTVIHCDNASDISLSKNLVQHSKAKHIPIKYHYFRQLAANKKIRLEYIPTQEQVVDIFTKPLNKDVFEHLRQKLGVIPSPN